MKDVESLERKIRSSITQWAKEIGYSFSSKDIVRLVQRHYGITFTWEQGLRFSSGDISLQSILDERREYLRRQAVKFAVIALIVSVGIYFYKSADRNVPSENKPVMTSPAVNSGWDNSVSQVVKYLKRTLRDPGSYEAIEWGQVMPNGSGGYTVRHKFRAKNGFGGYNIEDRIFVLDARGNVIDDSD